MDFSVFESSNAWFALATLSFLEIVLGIDNIVFISIVTNKLKTNQQAKARNIGLAFAMIFRILLLFGIAWVVSLKEGLLENPFNFSLMSFNPSGQSLIVFFGGLFLLYKAVSEIFHKLEGGLDGSQANAKNSIISIIIQIALLDLVFSLDSLITAIGIVSLEPKDAIPPGFGYEGGMMIIIISIVISIATMMVFAGSVSKFVNNHPSVQILGLSFLILIGFLLIVEGLHGANFSFNGDEIQSVSKGYLYFAIFFSLGVEFLNIRFRKKSNPVKLNDSELK